MNSTGHLLIRHANLKDLPALEQLYAQARAFMAASGNSNQWGDDKPTTEQIVQDIELGHGFVCMDNGIIVAAFAFHTQGDPTYAHIEGKGWPDGGSYGVVHRIATGGARHGAAAFCLAWCRAHCRQVRIDTHEDNIPMQHLLAKLGFVPCGTIYLEDGSPRLAYYR